MIVIRRLDINLEHQRNQRYFRSCTTQKKHKMQRTTQHTMSDFRRSRAVPPQPLSSATMGILLPSIDHTNQCITGRKMALTKLPYGLFRGRTRDHLCINIRLTVATNDANDATTIGILLPSIGTYHRMYHRPNDGILMKLRPSFIVVSAAVRSAAAAMIVCASTSPPIED